jgi:protein tyrosine phosphatase (PTP) superfamily phosphohydrolase (DUF442 family)
MIKRSHACGMVGVALALLALGAAATRPSAGRFEPLAGPGLENAHRVTAKVISGAQPEGEAGFAALQALRVKTIVSVDGARPDVETARRHGMRYVHLPIGYGGVGVERGEELAKALLELEGPVYVHCHHGKHRSAAAVAVACVMNGSLAPERAEEVLRTFGTGENYVGLWRDAREARPVERGKLEGKKVAYVEVARLGDLAEAMVAIDEHWEHLKQARQARWGKVEAHPDLSGAHEALQLMEHLVEIGRGEDAAKRDGRYRALLDEAIAGGRSLQGALAANAPAQPVVAAAAMQRLGAACAACHRAYRD